LATAYLDRKLLYNAETWTKIKTSDIKKLETVQNNFYERLIGVPRGCPNTAVIQELGIIPVEYKVQIKKLIEYHRIITMTEERLTKKSVIKTEQIGSINLLDDAYAISKKHNITYNDSQIKNMTANQWKRLVQKKVNDTVNKEIMEESSKKTKLHNISGLMQS